MMSGHAYLLLEEQLKNHEARLAVAPDDIELRLDRAALLNKLGRTDEAREAGVLATVTPGRCLPPRLT